MGRPMPNPGKASTPLGFAPCSGATTVMLVSSGPGFTRRAGVVATAMGLAAPGLRAAVLAALLWPMPLAGTDGWIAPPPLAVLAFALCGVSPGWDGAGAMASFKRAGGCGAIGLPTGALRTFGCDGEASLVLSRAAPRGVRGPRRSGFERRQVDDERASDGRA